MYWRVTSVKPLRHLALQVTFKDGLEGNIYFKPSYLTGVFEALKDESYFNQVYVDHGAVTWPGELDMAPDAMHTEIKKSGSWTLE